MTIRNTLLPLLILCLLAACNPARKAGRSKAQTTDTTVNEGKNQDTASSGASAGNDETSTTILNKLHHIDYETFSGRIAVDYADDKGKGNSFNVKLQMKKGELVWLSATGPFGIEGARVLITPDSVKIVNRLQREYIATGTDYLKQKMGLPVDFNTLQELLIGNPVFVNTTNATITKNEGGYQISSQTEQFRNLLQVLLPGYLPASSQLEDLDSSQQRAAHLTYGNYIDVEGQLFSVKRQIDVNYKSGLHIKMDFESHSFSSPLNTPFSVPSGYKRKQ
ncbi:DUF4292 domain-containing protein [Niabella terrae]